MLKSTKNFHEFKWLMNRTPEIIESNDAYRKRHPEFEKFDMPESFWFKIYPDRQVVHWAVLRKKEENFEIYFVNVNGQAFDKLTFKQEKVAKRLLKKNKFYSSKNVKPPYLPILPIFVNLCTGKKTAPYSKGRLWVVQDRFPSKKYLNRRRIKKEPVFEDKYSILDILIELFYSIINIIKYIAICFLIGLIFVVIFH